MTVINNTERLPLLYGHMHSLPSYLACFTECLLILVTISDNFIPLPREQFFIFSFLEDRPPSIHPMFRYLECVTHPILPRVSNFPLFLSVSSRFFFVLFCRQTVNLH